MNADNILNFPMQFFGNALKTWLRVFIQKYLTSSTNIIFLFISFLLIFCCLKISYLKKGFSKFTVKVIFLDFLIKFYFL